LNTFCLDTSGFIEPWHRNYPIDVFPSFWQRLDEWKAADRVFAPMEVYSEIEKVDDGLKAWIDERMEFFREPNEAVQDSVIKILATFPRLVDTRRGRSKGDPWVIAHAQTEGAIVITEETAANGRSPKIPDVCKALGIPCMPVMHLIREMKFTF